MSRVAARFGLVAAGGEMATAFGILPWEPGEATKAALHGGLSPGAPRGPNNGNFNNGDWTAEAIEERRWLRSLVRSFAQTGGGS